MRKVRLSQAPSLNTNGKLGLPMYLLIAIVVSFMAVISIPGTPLESKSALTTLNRMAGNVTPQGWAFFTKSSQDPTVLPFDSFGESMSLLPTARLTNTFGINRKGRAQGVELGLLQQYLLDSDWIDCSDASNEECIKRTKEAGLKTVLNRTPRPSLCGEVFLLKSVPRPYAYRTLVDESRRLIEGVGVNVQCVAA